ncbi:AMIN domain-containing protein [Desulfobacterales bacterium HSG2]|nr:AMIN domain-containing protein [Desulfobacterales bacterium HSG2]
MKCPKCASENVTHSHRRGMEKIIRYVYPRVPYRCKECWTRFWKFENPLRTLASKIMLILVILLIAGACVWFFSQSREQRTPQPVQKKTRPVARPIKKAIPKMEVEEPASETEKPEKSEEPEKTEIVKREEGMTPEAGGPSDTEPVRSDERTEEPAELPVETPVEQPEAPVAQPEVPVEQPEAPVEQPEAPVAQPEVPVEQPEAVAQPEVPAEQPELPVAEPTPKPTVIAKKPKEKRSRRILKGIQHQSTEEEFRLELLSDGPIYDYKQFTMSPPPKVVLDLPGRWRYSGRYTIRVKSDIARRVRVGKHSNKLRLVLDLKGSKTWIPVIEESSEGLTLIIKK